MCAKNDHQAAEHHAFADLLCVLKEVKYDVLIQPYGTDELFCAEVDPKLMDRLIDAYEACVFAEEDAA